MVFVWATAREDLTLLLLTEDRWAIGWFVRMNRNSVHGHIVTLVGQSNIVLMQHSSAAKALSSLILLTQPSWLYTDPTVTEDSPRNLLKHRKI